MLHHKALKPATSAEVFRLQDVGFGRLDIRSHTPSPLANQPDKSRSLDGAGDLAPRWIERRYGLPRHLSILVAGLAGFREAAT
jgi:hypothetical protein